MLRPLNDVVVVEMEPAVDRSHLIHSIQENNVRVGRVLAVGAGKCFDDGYRPTEVKVGERVAFIYLVKMTHNGRRLAEILDAVEGKDCVAIRELDILFVLEGEETPYIEAV
jgi:co-chaperonin GroES (HSP10)